MDVARVNFSHGTHEYHRTIIRRLKKVRAVLKKPLAIVQDLQGPKIRLGWIAGDHVELRSGKTVVLTADRVPGDERAISVSLKTLPDVVSAGHPILLADGRIELVVENVSPPHIRCRVVVGGAVSSHKGINLPGSRLRVESLTPKDRRDLVVGLEEGVDAVALSFVRSAADVLATKRLIAKLGRTTPVVAKIEKHEAVTNIDSILEAANAIMVARGDLGVEIDLERVPLVQKMVIRKCNVAGKPVITATQMLARMVDNPRPTRAEAADVANAILDGTDAVMLSEETAMGAYPVEAVTMMDRIARSAEQSLAPRAFDELPAEPGTSDAISRAAHLIARQIGAAAIVTPTWSGSTACLVSRFRPRQPILASTPNEAALDCLALSWGVVPLKTSRSDSIDGMVRETIRAARQAGLLESGQHVVVTGGVPLQVTGTTNFIRVERVP
jgi:pyruvate kinase